MVARILVIDDQPAVLATVETILESLGHTAVTANSAERGLAIVGAEHLDLLITDIFMPDMDGIETLRLVRAQKPRLPIIVMSGSLIRASQGSALDFLDMATKLGAIRSMRKPFKRAELADAIAACLAGREQAPNDAQ